ncbi:hypothetical protein BS78_09G156500 [Paspalum vaginatum]|nr:hypothetical protein BS78_09G156500 [Paspalum vaginatum]
METVVMVLLTVMVGLFGVTSAVLGFIAEGKRLTPAQIHVSGRECIYPANAAHTLGICAVLLLLVAQIIALVAGGCCGCCRPGGGASKPKARRRVIGVIVAVLSWIAALLAGVFYFAGARLNAPGSRAAIFSGDDVECHVVRAGVFTKAAVLSLVATSFGIKSCIFLRAPAGMAAPTLEQGAAEPANKPDGQRPAEAAVAVGMPQRPAQG